jgi:hypothetical protein
MLTDSRKENKMLEYLQPYDGPVFEGLEAREVVYAKDQPQYIPLRTLVGEAPDRKATSRWTLTPEQRKAIADGADIFLTLSTFGHPLQPIQMFVSDDRQENGATHISRSWLKMLLLVAVIALPIVGYAKAPKVKRNYHKYTIEQITAESPSNWKHPLSHVETFGWLTYKLHEGDADWHLRLCTSAVNTAMDAKTCIVAECIPALPCVVPKVGDCVTVQGITRYDGENPGHHWWEVHPVEKLTVTPDACG